MKLSFKVLNLYGDACEKLHAPSGLLKTVSSASRKNPHSLNEIVPLLCVPESDFSVVKVCQEIITVIIRKSNIL